MARNRPLDQITLSGYKSIRSLNQLRLLHGLNVLIGANGSGKSNFIQFFEMLGHMMDANKGLQNYVSQRGRADAFLFQGVKVTQQMEAVLEFGENNYTFALRAADDRSLFFADEITRFNSWYGPFTHEQGSGHRESKLTTKQSHAPDEEWVLETIADWRVYHFHDTSPSAPVMGPINAVDNIDLHSNAANLAAFLLRIEKEHPETYGQIIEVVRQVAPFFGSFVLREDSLMQTQLLWKDRYSDLLYYPYQLSDGTLRFICLAALLLQPNPPSTIIIDEPELGLHPFAIQLLASMLHEAASKVQLIVSTQSSLLVDEVEPENVIVVNQKEGESILQRLDSEQLDEWLAEYTLGQLWEKNVIGGLP